MAQLEAEASLLIEFASPRLRVGSFSVVRLFLVASKDLLSYHSCDIPTTPLILCLPKVKSKLVWRMNVCCVCLKSVFLRVLGSLYTNCDCVSGSVKVMVFFNSSLNPLVDVRLYVALTSHPFRMSSFSTSSTENSSVLAMDLPPSSRTATGLVLPPP